MTAEERNQLVAIGLRRIFFLNQLMQHDVEWIIGVLPGTRIDQLLRVANKNLRAQLTSAKVCLGEEAREYLNDVLDADELKSLGHIINMLAEVQNIAEYEREIQRITDKAKKRELQEGPIQ